MNGRKCEARERMRIGESVEESAVLGKNRHRGFCIGRRRRDWPHLSRLSSYRVSAGYKTVLLLQLQMHFIEHFDKMCTCAK